MSQETIYQYSCSFDNGYTGEYFYIKTDKGDLTQDEHDKLIKDFLKNPALGRSQCNHPFQLIECLKSHGYKAEMIAETHPQMPFNKESLPYLHNISGNY